MSKEVIKTQHSELHKRGSWRGSLKELFVSATVLGKGADSKDDRSIVLCCGDAGGKCTEARGEHLQRHRGRISKMDWEAGFHYWGRGRGGT